MIQNQFPTTPVIVTSNDVSIEGIREFMRLGVVDVLPQPIRSADLVIALDHAARQKSEPPRQAASGSPAPGNVVTFLKCGGGVGATTLLVQGGCILAKEIKRENRKVCLLDFDIQFGSAGLFLDISGGATLTDLLDAPERLDAALLRGVMNEHSSGLAVLQAPREMIPLDSVSPEFVTSCLDIARREYDYVLVDLPAAWTFWTYETLRQSDLIVLVTQLSVGAIRQTMRQLETLGNQGLSDIPTKLVLNRYSKPRRFAGLIGPRSDVGKRVQLRDAEKALGREFDHHIANSYLTVSEALNQGVQLSEVELRSKVEKSIRKMLDDVKRTVAETRAHAGAAE